MLRPNLLKDPPFSGTAFLNGGYVVVILNYLYIYGLSVLFSSYTICIKKSHVMAKVEEEYPIDLGLTSNNKFIIVNRMHVLILGVLR